MDRLGDRLRRSGTPDKDDGELFEAYRSSFDRAHHEVVGVLSSLAVSVTDAPTIATRRKTLESTIAKLRRIRIRLSRIEDIAGCRVVLDGLAEQDLLLSRALDSLDIVRRRDYRLAPDHGYRAVHLVVRSTTGDRVEVQVRTRFQHGWANISERIASIRDMEVKYGGGPTSVRDALDSLSESLFHYDQFRTIADSADLERVLAHEVEVGVAESILNDAVASEWPGGSLP